MSDKKLVLLISSGILAFASLWVVLFWLVAYQSPSTHMTYKASHFECDARCSVVVTMTNNGQKPFHTDYLGTDGNGISEVGHPRTNFIGTDGRLCPITPSELNDTNYTNILPGKSLTVTLSCEDETFSHVSEIKSLEMFGDEIWLSTDE